MAGIAKEVKNHLLHVFHNVIHFGRGHENDFNLAKHHKQVVIFVPGFSLSSYSIGKMVKEKLEALDCKAFAFDAGANLRDICQTAGRLAVFVEEVCEKCKIEKVFILAHSMGGLIAQSYSFNFNGCHRINKIITVATPFTGTHVAWLACPTKAGRQMLPGSKFLKQLKACPLDCWSIVSIRAKRDEAIKPKSSSILAGAKNIEVPVVGHTTIMQAPETWEIIRKELELA